MDGGSSAAKGNISAPCWLKSLVDKQVVTVARVLPFLGRGNRIGRRSDPDMGHAIPRVQATSLVECDLKMVGVTEVVERFRMISTAPSIRGPGKEIGLPVANGPKTTLRR